MRLRVRPGLSASDKDLLQETVRYLLTGYTPTWGQREVTTAELLKLARNLEPEHRELIERAGARLILEEK